MRQNSKIRKSHNIIKYKAYTALLEGSINQREHDMLVELGFLDKVKSFFGGGMEVGGDLAKLFKDKVNQKQLQLAKDNITKAIADLKAIAGKAGVDESVVNEFLKGVLDEAGASPQDIASAQPSGGESGADASKEATPGTPVTAAAVEKSPAVAAKIVADVTGKDEEKVADELEKKKPDIAALTGVLGNAIGKTAGVDGGLATKVVKALIDKGHLKLESGMPLTRSGLVKFINEVKSANAQLDVMDRWQQLAGLNEALLVEREADTAAFDELMKMIDSGEIKTVDQLNQWLAGPKGQKAGLSKAMKKQLTAAFEKKNPKEDKKEVEKAVAAAPEAKEAPGGKEASPEEQKKAEETKKQYGAAFKDVRSVIKPEEADDTTLAKVIDAIDGFKSIAIAA